VQKVNYIHENAVKAGFVTQAEYWKYSSAADYCGVNGLVKMELLW
jgi:putative transposase